MDAECTIGCQLDGIRGGERQKLCATRFEEDVNY